MGKTYKTYKYRWIILAVFFFIVATNQMLWITFAPITNKAAQFFKVSNLQIGILSMIFMIVYIIISIPASWVIDTYGFKIGVSIGALLTGIFGLTRGIFSHSYTVVLLSQTGIALGQPFILNAITKIAAKWFAFDERGTASGIGTLAIYMGIVSGMIITPSLTEHLGIEKSLLIYGVIAMFFALLFILLSKENPPTPASPPELEERALVLDGIKNIFKVKDFILLMVVFFIGLGVFNGIMTWIEEILRPRGFTSIQAGITGSLMVIGGIVGALILPILSDKIKKRTPFIVVALLIAIPNLIALTFFKNYFLLLVSSFLLGFFLLSAGPIGFQYGAEITYPTPEGTSNGFLLMMGQISGILFIIMIDSLKSNATGSMTLPLLILTFLVFITFLLSLKLKESSLLKYEDVKVSNNGTNENDFIL